MNRNFGLDLLRAISIWLVLLQHLGLSVPGFTQLKIGGVGVEIFFVLSGFLIGGILFKEINKGLGFKKTLFNFWIRRWFRILPLYYGILLFKFIFLDHSVGWNIIYYILFLQNNFYGIDFYHVTWSLVIEEWFYIFVPIFLLVAQQFTQSKKGILLLCLTFIVFVNVLRLLYVSLWDVPYVGVNSNFPFRFDSLFLGVVLAYLQLNFTDFFKKLQNLKTFMLGFILFLAYLSFFYALSTPENKIDQSVFIRTAGFFILPFTITLMVPFVAGLDFNIDGSYLKKILFHFITYTSLLTYAIYLLHPLVFTFVTTLALSVFTKYLLCVILTYIAAFTVYKFYEKPILQLRERFTV